MSSKFHAPIAVLAIMILACCYLWSKQDEQKMGSIP